MQKCVNKYSDRRDTNKTRNNKSSSFAAPFPTAQSYLSTAEDGAAHHMQMSIPRAGPRVEDFPPGHCHGLLPHPLKFDVLQQWMLPCQLSPLASELEYSTHHHLSREHPSNLDAAQICPKDDPT